MMPDGYNSPERWVHPPGHSLLLSKIDLYINYKVAQELGLTVPEGLLSQATQIIR
jgi:ABC-type uncharacterized transport system substrate-binding protein